MKINTIFSITAIFVITFVGFVTHNARALEVTTNLRPWLEEEEFSLDTSLHATLDQVIIFELEPPDTRDRHKKRHKKDRDKYHHKHAKEFEEYKNYQWHQEEHEKDNDEFRKGYEEDHDRYHSKKGRHKKQKLYLGDHELTWNSIRFFIPEATEGSFCLLGDEPYIAALELETADGERVLWSRPGDDCTILELEADRYLLHVLHDPQNIDGQGRKVFFHRPGQARLLGNVDSNFIAPNFMAFKGPNGQFVSDDTSDTPLLSVQAIATSVGPHEVWRLGANSPYTLTDGNGARFKNNLSITAQFVGKSPDTGDFTATYKITDLGNSQFILSLHSFVDAPINTRNAEQQLFRSSTNHATFTADYKGFDCKTCDSSTLPLQEGEAALFAGCNYTGPAIVFGGDVPDLSIYDGAAALGLGIGDNMAASIRLGPNTFGILYEDSQFSGTSIGVGTDTPCLDVTDLGTGALSSLQVTTDIRQYIIVSDACENCDLTGLDLSDLDFTAGVFTGTNFSDANLTNTVFRSARLDHATFFGNSTILAGTDFADAVLFCTDLSGNDLSTASFDDDPIITKDFSCRLDLSRSTLAVNAIPFASWRYINFTGGSLLNGPGTTISTLADPVDLSGAMLSSVTGLSGVMLDGADLGCATPTETEKNCTELIDTDLSKASLIQAILAAAAMNGANLTQANLEMADLGGTQLLKSPTTSDSAKLDGAFLKNANLAQADLSGASLTHANWYSISPKTCPGSTWTGTCASGEGTTLSNVNLEGAYLNGLDLSNAILQGANLDGALLVGVDFTSAKLGPDSATGASTSLIGAFLQGANFTDAGVTGADFLSAYVDLTSTGGGSLAFQLPGTNLNFTGYWKDPADPECVLFDYSSQTTVPPNTASSNTCPDAGSGPCTDTQWQSPSTPISQAQPPSSSNYPTMAAGACTTFADLDFNW